MIYSKYRFTLDIKKTQSQVSIPVLLRDTGWGLYINLIDDGKPFVITQGCSAVFVSKKPNGSTLFESCIIEGDTIRYDFTADTTSVEGKHECEIRLYGDNGRMVTCPNFTIIVDKRVVGEDDIGVSDADKSALDNIFLREASRVAAENARTIAESKRVEAEAKRAAAELKREGNFKSVFIRYSAYADGKDFSETWSSSKYYIGVAISNAAPTDKKDYTWCKFIGTGSANVAELEKRVETIETELNSLEDIFADI